MQPWHPGKGMLQTRAVQGPWQKPEGMKLQPEGLRWEHGKDRTKPSSGRWGEVESRCEEHPLMTKWGSVVASVGRPLPQGGGGTWEPGSCLGLHACLTPSVHHTVCGLIDAWTILGRNIITSLKACLTCSIISDFTYRTQQCTSSPGLHSAPARLI